MSEHAVNFRAYQQLIPGVEQAVPPTRRVSNLAVVETQPRPERRACGISEPTPVACVPKALQQRPAALRLLAHRRTYRSNLAIAHVQERLKHLRSIQCAQDQRTKPHSAATRFLNEVRRA